jgi:hypothetical protein
MKKLLPYILILVVLVGVFGPIDIVYSQSIFRLSVSSLLQSAVVNLANAILIFLSWIAGFAGAILDYVLSFTIVNMNVNVFGDGSPANPGITGINTAWKIIKDLMNIAFIFILLYESIKIIIGQGSVESVKRFVLGIVLASLLINFSLFFTKVLIDASNIVTIGVYRSILSTPVAPPQPGQPPTTNSIATILLSKLKLQTIYSTSNPDLSTNGIGGALIFLIGSSIIFLISTFILFAITANFVIRYITLIILLVLSPIAYMGIALNAVQPYQKKWWDSLKGQLLFAPVFMIMLMIVITLISSPGFVSQGTFADLFLNTNVSPNANAASGSGATAGTSASGLVLNFALVIGLLIATLTVSKSVAKSGADQIGTMTSKLTGYAGGALMGGTARLGRSTVGRWGANKANDEDLKDRASKGGVGGFTARMQLAAANRAATSSFDTRATDSFGALSKATGMGTDFGKVDSKKTNFRAITEQRAKDEAEKVKQYYKISDDANAIAKNKDKQAKEAEDRLKSSEFTNAENRRWQETEDGKREKETEDALNTSIKLKSDNDAKIEENRNKLKELQKTLDWTESNEEKARLQSEIDNIKLDDERRKNEITSLNSAIDSRRKIYEEAKAKRDSFKSKERLAEEEIVKLGKDNESKLKERYKDRVDSYADRIENGGAMYRYGSTVAKITGGAVLGGVFGGIPGAAAGAGYVLSQSEQTNNPADRRAVARKIRGVTSEKKKISKKVLKEEFGYDVEDDADENKEGNKKEDDAPKEEKETKTT